MSNRTIQHVYSGRGAALEALVAAPAPAEAAPELGPLLSVLFAQLDELSSMVLHVTSATRGEGTTTVAREIAAAAAAAGWCSVALIDAHPAERRESPGMVEQVERGEEPSLQRHRVGGVQMDIGVLSTSGRAVSRLESVRGVYGTLRKRYSLTVVDCPAVFSGQQLTILASAADETILVLEAERSNLADVVRAREALERRGASILGVVMNKSRRRIPKLLDGLL